VKRVVGLPGEEVEVRSGRVYVDDIELDESYLKAEYQDHHSYGPVVVPRDSFFVMGDHRNSSNDSRHWGCVPRNNIFGKAIFRYWPVQKMGALD
jgi:signal peptidase I